MNTFHAHLCFFVSELPVVNLVILKIFETSVLLVRYEVKRALIIQDCVQSDFTPTVQREIFARQKFSRFSRLNTSSRNFVPVKICSSKNFLLTSQAQCLRATDPVNRQKADLFCRRSLEQTQCGNFSRPTINSPQLRIDPRSQLPPFGMAAFRRQ